MNVLIIDDESTVGTQRRLKNFTPGRRYNRSCKIDVAKNFYEAEKLLTQNGQTYDLIISDLLMSGYGLDRTLNSNNDTVLNGWIFLYHKIVSSTGTYYTKCANAKIIIFSAYTDVLNQYLEEESEEEESKKCKERVIIVEKGYSEGYNNLMNTVSSLFSN